MAGGFGIERFIVQRATSKILRGTTVQMPTVFVILACLVWTISSSGSAAAQSYYASIDNSSRSADCASTRSLELALRGYGTLEQTKFFCVGGVSFARVETDAACWGSACITALVSNCSVEPCASALVLALRRVIVNDKLENFGPKNEPLGTFQIEVEKDTFLGVAANQQVIILGTTRKYTD